MNCVDVVIPCYRYANFLEQCVGSVLGQEGVQVRVLIIDDASPDNTAAVAEALVQRDSRVSFKRHSFNQGHIKTYNEGIAWAASDYMLILSADDYLLPGALRRAVQVFQQYPDVGLVFGNVMELHDDDHLVETAAEVPASAPLHVFLGQEFLRTSGSRNFVKTPTAVVRTELQRRLGGYEEALPHSGDMEMWLRFAAHGDVAYLNEYQAVYRRHGANMSVGYDGRLVIRDLEQRRAALQCFFSRCAALVVDPKNLERRAYASLARDAMGFASAAFNENDVESTRRLYAFSVEVWPSIHMSPPGLKFALKQAIGPRLWRILRPSWDKVRRHPRSDRA